MKRRLTVISLVLSFVFAVVGCSDSGDTASSAPSVVSSAPAQTSATSSVPEIKKSEMELLLEGSAWQINGETVYLTFSNDKRVTAYDLSWLDCEHQEAGKFLSYDLGTAENGTKTLTVYYLTEEEQTIFEFQKDTKSFLNATTGEPLQAVSMKSFVQTFMNQIQAAQQQGEETWGSQGEINQGISTLCSYWDSLYQLVNTYLQTVSPQQYQVINEENKTFASSRDLAMQEAGKEVEGGSSYQMVTGNVYCTQTQSRIETIMNQDLK